MQLLITMLGDFQYCSSSSEKENSDNSEFDSDCSDKSDDCIDKLMSEKSMVEQKIRAYEEKLKSIQKTLRSLNSERNTLLSLRDKLISSTYLENDADTNENVDLQNSEQASFINDNTVVGGSRTGLSNDMVEPLNLHVPKPKNTNDEEEFDSEDD